MRYKNDFIWALVMSSGVLVVISCLFLESFVWIKASILIVCMLATMLAIITSCIKFSSEKESTFR